MLSAPSSPGRKTDMLTQTTPIASTVPTDDSTARNTITQVVKTMFPGGRI